MKKPLFIGCGAALCAVLAAAPLGVSADPTTAALQGLSYRAIGPAIAGGRTTAVAGSDRDPAVYYAGGAGGGVFKSVDGGVSWRAVFDRQDVAPIGAIAVSPRDPNDVWVGTGEANPRNDVEEGAGIWHSTDGGKHWTHAGLDDAGSISTLSIDPRNPRVVVAAVLGHVFRDSTMRGIYVTRDAGAHWARALYVGPSSGASDVVRVPDRPSTLFAGIWQFRRRPWTMTSGGPHGGLYRSDDNGATWRKLTGHGLPVGITGRIGLAAARRGRIYAIVQARGGDIWRSDDGGASWQVMPHQPLVGARRFYFSRLYVDPSNRDRVMNVSLILSLSRDGARTFKPIATEAGWDYHSTWWSQDGRRVINGNDEGVILSYDGAAHWSQPYDLPFAQPYHVGLDDALPSYRLCIGLQDNGSWCGVSSSENGLGVLNRDWLTVGPGDGMWNVFDPADHALVWNSTTNSDPGQVYLYDGHTQQMREISPDAHNVQDAASALRYRFNWDTPVAFGSDGQALAGGNVLFRSADRGIHWTVVSPDLTRNEKSHQGVSGGPIDQDASGAEISDTILCIAPSKAAAGQIWVGTDDGLVQLTRDNAASWSNVTPAALPAWGRVYTVEPGHASAATAYVAVDRHMSGDDRPYLFATDDYGASWRSIAGDLPPALFVRVIREDPTDANLLYAGTRRGVFVSFDRGGHWHALRLNMPATAIYDVQIQPQAGDLVVASHGRGVWILDDLRPLRAWAHAPARDATLFAPRDAYRTFRNPPVNAFLNGTLPAGEYAGANRPYGALLSYYLPRAAKKVQLAILDANGAIIRHLPAKGITRHAGMNRAAWDLTDDGPVRWNGTFEQNKGPETGAEAVPGAYVVRLTVDGAAQTQPLTVDADPRETAPADEALRRHVFLAAENAQLSRVDTMLNELDLRLRRATPAQAGPLRTFRSRLTLDPQNIEDLRTPPRVRERLLDLIGRVGTSFQAPTAAHEAEARTVRAEYDALVAAYAGVRAR